MTIWLIPIAILGQTRVTQPKNKYKVQDDIKLGEQASTEVEKQFPIINDADATPILSVLVPAGHAIPPQFRQTGI